MRKRKGLSFCGIAEGQIACEIVDSDAATVAFLEMNPPHRDTRSLIPAGTPRTFAR